MSNHFALIILFLLFQSTACCKPGWLQFQEKCYWFSNFALDWYRASSCCQALSSKLAEPLTKPEMDFLSSETIGKVNEYWIGVTDMVLEHSWVYASSLSSMTVQNWNPGEPNGILDQNCGFLQSPHGKLIDHMCDTSRRFVCEIENVSHLPSHVG